MKLLSILTLIVKTQTYLGDKIIIEVNAHCKCTCTHSQMSTNKIWEIRIIVADGTNVSILEVTEYYGLSNVTIGENLAKFRRDLYYFLQLHVNL